MHLQSSYKKSAKTKEKENRSCTGNPSFSKNRATAQQHYSYESWLRIWNPGLFLILTRGPCLLVVVVRLQDPPESGRLQQEAADGLASASHGHARPWPWSAAARARALLVPWPWRSTHSETSCEGEDGEQGVEEDVEASE